MQKSARKIQTKEALLFKHNLDNLEMNLHSIKIDKVLDGMGFPKNYYDLKNLRGERK